MRYSQLKLFSIFAVQWEMFSPNTEYILRNRNEVKRKAGEEKDENKMSQNQLGVIKKRKIKDKQIIFRRIDLIKQFFVRLNKL